MTKAVGYILLICGICSILSCGGKLEPNKTGFEKLQTELISKYGADAYYTDIQLTLTTESEVSALVTETKDPSSMKQEQWLRYGGGEWEKQADVIFSVQGAEAKSFMFQLNKEVSLSTMSDLLEKSKAQLAKEKQIKDPVFVSAVVSSKHQMNSKETGIFYYITLLDKASQKDYRFVYDLKGNAMSSLDE
ncbi:hypothetical protein F0919_06550 [Taibaiella lutea]|uniref:Uncharacterized protein n=1 Tax=Taibaiella lutea TaxID=2608001 RepID=A0A5M6CVS4_9BACT|nr:hypothetical protein [Taibaiella lutea]KAA5537329.1 hypothetical protein F0919_06550 [Taibaiella lutea]